jgi:hypothetical protein
MKAYNRCTKVARIYFNYDYQNRTCHGLHPVRTKDATLHRWVPANSYTSEHRFGERSSKSKYEIPGKIKRSLKLNKVNVLNIARRQSVPTVRTSIQTQYRCKPSSAHSILHRNLNFPVKVSARVGAVALYTVLWSVVAKYRKWPFSAPHRTKTP